MRLLRLDTRFTGHSVTCFQTSSQLRAFSPQPTFSASPAPFSVSTPTQSNPIQASRQVRAAPKSGLLSHRFRPSRACCSADKMLTFEELLISKTGAIRNDFKSGARAMATTALRSLRDLLRPAFTKGQRDRKEVFGLLVTAARELVGARPAMSAAISAVLLRAIDTLAKEWRIDATESDSAPRTLEDSDLKQAQQIFPTLLAEREASIKVLGCTFATHIFTTYFRPAEAKHTPFRLLTLSDSSTISHALSELCTLYVDSCDSGDLPDGIEAPIYRRPIHISILESRPRCEGADLAARLFRHARSKSPVHLPEAKDEMLKITIFPDCAVAAAVREADVLLLGADRIGVNGDVRNKIGSLAAVCAVKMLNAKARVMVVSDVNKISSGESEGVGDWHGPGELMGCWREGAREGFGWNGSGEEKKGEENGEVGCNEEVQKQVRAEVYGEWFETVPADLCEMEYITDRGVLKREEIMGLGKEVSEWKEKYFGDS